MAISVTSGTWAINSSMVGIQPIAVTSTTKNHPLGTIVKAVDTGSNAYGEGEFIYLLGVGSTVVGSVVTYDLSTRQTVLCAVAGGIARPVAIAMSANVASQYGWYQIGGIAVASKLSTVSVATGLAVGVLSTGTVAGTASLKEIFGAVFAAVCSATSGGILARISINRPHKQGRIS